MKVSMMIIIKPEQVFWQGVVGEKRDKKWQINQEGLVEAAGQC
jgi:hypothetical protein